LTSNLGSLFIFAKSTLYLGWQKKNFLSSWRSVICIFKKSGGPFRGGAVSAEYALPRIFSILVYNLY
jgi:hypothetical protein